MSASDLPRRLPRYLAALACCATLASAFGQQASREEEQVRRLRLQVQRLQQDLATERSAAQQAKAETASVAAERDAAATVRDSAQGQLRNARSAIATEKARSATLEQQLAAAQNQAVTLQAQLAQSQAQLRASGELVITMRADANALQQRLQARDTAYGELQTRHVRQADGLRICIASNLALRDIGTDLLQRYANKTVAEVVAQNEPFLQFQRVKLENLLQGYEDRLDQLAVPPAAAKVPARAP